MNANAVIESYVREVASCLPRAKRNDVAFELHALLADEMAARAQAEGRAPDRAMAMDLLARFGRPAEAARRYHERPALIEPADTHHFLIWALAGAVALGVVSAVGGRGSENGGLFLQWLGVLVIWFAATGSWRRRHPERLGWRPKRDPDWIPRWLALLAVAATLIFPVFMYAAPRTFVQTMFLGAVPSGGLELAEPFRQSWQRAATLALLIVSAALYAGVAVQGRWRPWVRWAGVAVNLLLGLLLLAHAAPGGPVFPAFLSPAANRVADPIFGAVGTMMLLFALYYAWAEWGRISPAPAHDTASPR